MEELRGRNALVTGAGGGLGGYIARALAAEGVNLALTDLPEAPVDGLAAELRSRGVEVSQAPADLADADERQRLASWAAESVGPLDILVNNAGVEFGGSFVNTTERELETSVMVNLLAVMDLTRIVLPGMLERRTRPRRQHRLARRQDPGAELDLLLGHQARRGRLYPRAAGGECR